MQLGLETLAATIAGLEAVIVTVIPDNLLYDAWSRGHRVAAPDESATFFGDLVRIHFDALESVGIQRGDIQITIESGGLIVLLRNISSHYVLSVVFQDHLPLGLMRLHTDRIIRLIQRNLPGIELDDASHPFPIPEEPEDEPQPQPEFFGYPDGYTPKPSKLHQRPAEFFGYPEGSAPQPARLPSENRAAFLAAEEEASAATPTEDAPEEAPAEPVFHGYVYARDRERLAAQAKRDAERVEGDAYTNDAPASVTEAPTETGGLMLDVEADQLFGHDAPEPTDNSNAAPHSSTHDSTRGAHILRTVDQEESMQNEGGPPLPLDSPAIHDPQRRTTIPVEIVGDPEPSNFPDSTLPQFRTNEDSTPHAVEADDGFDDLAGELPEMASLQDQPFPFERVAEQDQTTLDQAGDFHSTHASPLEDASSDIHTAENTDMPTRITTTTVDMEITTPPASASRTNDEAQAHLRAKRRMEFEGGIIAPEPVDTPTECPKDLRLAHQELAMTDEGSPAQPISQTAKVEEHEHKLAKARHDDDAAQHRTSIIGGMYRTATESKNEEPRRYPSMARETREALLAQGAGQTRAELIIAYVAANTSSPQNIHARLAVHSRVPLDSIREPQTLNAEETQRLEDAAKSILGISQLIL